MLIAFVLVRKKTRSGLLLVGLRVIRRAHLHGPTLPEVCGIVMRAVLVRAPILSCRGRLVGFEAKPCGMAQSAANQQIPSTSSAYRLRYHRLVAWRWPPAAFLARRWRRAGARLFRCRKRHARRAGAGALHRICNGPACCPLRPSGLAGCSGNPALGVLLTADRRRVFPWGAAAQPYRSRTG